MKKNLLLLPLLTASIFLNAQNIGIGTTNPSEKLEVNGNIKAGNFLYTTPRTLRYTLSGIHFRSENSLDTAVIGVGSGSIAMQNLVAGKRLIAAVQLPDGVTVTNMTVYITDVSATENLQVIFYRKTITSNFFPDNLGFINSSGSPAGVVGYPTPVFNHAVDNSIYTYYISAGTQSNGLWINNFFLHAVVIEYTRNATE
jgi:hypothetical protein